MNVMRRAIAFGKTRRKIIHVGIAALGLGALASTAEAQAVIPCGEPYIIVSGDTLGAISERAYGAGRLQQLYQVNAATIGPNMNAINVGDALQIPCALGGGATEITAQADFSPPPEPPAADEPDTSDPMPGGAEAILVFNKASAPKFIMNVGIIDPYLTRITEVTQGRVQFIDPPEINRDPRAQLDLVLSGQVDGAYVFNGYLAQSHPLLQLPMQPLMGGTAEQTAGAMWRLHEQYLSKTDYFEGIQVLGFIGAPAAHIWRLREAPVKPGEDLVKTNEYTVPYFEGLDTRGAPAVREENAAWLAEFDEERGTPLTFAMAHGAARAGGIWNENRTVTEIANGVYTPTFSVVLSQAAWDRISPADQQAIMEISGEALSLTSLAWDEFDNGHRRTMIELGLDVVKADVDLLAELQDRSRTGLEAWINQADRMGLPGYEAFKFYNKNLTELARPTEF